MKRSSIIASGIVFALVAACGGRVDNGSSSSSSSGTVPTVTRPQPPPPGSGRGRPPSSVTGASVASQIAEAYCKGFSSCCVGAGQPPIDVTRCRLLVAGQIAATIADDVEARVEDVAVCVDAVKLRLTTCSPVDAPWWTSDTAAILAPSNVRSACSTIFDLAPTKTLSCETNASCTGLAATCAIDECTAAKPIGTACTSRAGCIDGASCIDGTCSAPRDVQENGACTSDEDCRLGLVCAKTVCLKARDVPGYAANTRFSPYRIGADTCRAYSTL